MEVDGRKDDDARLSEAVAGKLSRRILPLLCIGTAVYFNNRLQINLAATQLMDELEVDSRALGFAISSFSLSYGLLIIPAASIAARLGGPVSLSACCLCFGLVAMSTAAVTSYAGLIACRACLGVVMTPWLPVVSAYCGHFFETRMSKAMALTITLGFTLAQVVPIGSGILFAFNSWRFLFLLLGIPAVLLSPILYLLLPVSMHELAMFPPHSGVSKSCGCSWVRPLLNDEERAWVSQRYAQEKVSDAEASAPSGDRKVPAIFRLLRDWRTDLVVLATAAGFGAFTGLSYWSPTLVEGDDLWSPGASALFVTIPFVIATPVSILYSAFADRRGKHIRWATLGQLVILIGIITSALAVATPNQKRYTPLVIATLTVKEAGFAMWYNCFVAYQNKLFPRELRASGFAFVNFGNSLGTFAGPILVGSAAQSFNYPVAVASLSVLSLVSLAAMLILVFTESSTPSRIRLEADDLSKIEEKDEVAETKDG